MVEKLVESTNISDSEKFPFALSLYSPEAQDFLLQLSKEELERLGKKCFYHSTFREQAESILEKGLMQGALQYREDFEFITRMFDKYGVKSGWEKQFFKNFVLGDSYRKRSVFLSTNKEEASRAYQVPERLIFLLRAASNLLTKPHVSPEDKESCRALLEKFREKFSSGEDDTYVFEVNMLCPPVLSYFVESYSRAETKKRVWILETITDPDINFPEPIDAQYLKVAEIKPLNIQDIEERIRQPIFIFPSV